MLLDRNKLIQWESAPLLDNSHPLIFCLPFPAFRAINPSVISSWRQPGVGNDNGQSLKIHPCGLEIHLCVGKYTSAVGICTKTTFPHFPFCRPGKGQHTEHRGRLWPTKVLQSHFSFSLLNSMNMTNKNQRRPKKTT